MTVATTNRSSLSWYEASARQRLEAFVDAGSFDEFIGPELREMSPLWEMFKEGVDINAIEWAHH